MVPFLGSLFFILDVGENMWYIIQVRTGLKENIRMQCRKNITPDVLKDCFIPYYEEQKRFRPGRNKPYGSPQTCGKYIIS